MDEHTRNERMGTFREVLTNSTLFSDTMFATTSHCGKKTYVFNDISAKGEKREEEEIRNKGAF